MPEYVLSPYIHSIESHLDPENLRSAFFHQMTGDVLELPTDLREVLWSTRSGKQIVIDPGEMTTKGEGGRLILNLIDSHFLIEPQSDPIEALLNYTVIRPIQNPAVSYRSKNDELAVARVSMASRVCSPSPGTTPEVVEEQLEPRAGEVYSHADGSLTLRELLDKCRIEIQEGKQILEFLSSPERQLIKLARPNHDLDDPDQSFNAVPRNLYHSDRWQSEASTSPSIDFHTGGIEDADWEFDLIEPTVNHAFRFPSAALGGDEYGARFCEATFAGHIPGGKSISSLNVLEVGGGTGTFALSFIQRATAMLESSGLNLNYHILELSPVLAESQKKRLSAATAKVVHFQQNALAFEIPDRRFDLIIANEVAADFPTAPVTWQANDDSPQDSRWVGDGASYLEKYGLSVEQVPQSFTVNAGTFQFVERAWEHLNPGGLVILTEYGAADLLPVQILHLNHDEFSIHFGHVKSCAEKIGFKCELLSLAEFLRIDDRTPMFAGNDEHIICLNYVLSRVDMRMPYAALSKTDFEKQFGPALEKIELTGPRFLPLSRGFYYGPRLDEFMVLIMTKP